MDISTAQQASKSQIQKGLDEVMQRMKVHLISISGKCNAII